MYDIILKLAKEYRNIVKKADVVSDLAIRIMHSLVPYTVDHPDEARSVQTHLTEKHLLDVAKRYIKNAMDIIWLELYEMGDHISCKAIENAGYTKNYKLAIEQAIKGFEKLKKSKYNNIYERIDQWGDNKWIEYCRYVYMLIVEVEAFEQSNSYEDKEKHSGMISAYMNLLDGLSHNTGSFLDKMVLFIDNQKSRLPDLKKLMDAKQLSNKDDVIDIIKKYIHDNPDAYLYTDYLRKFYGNLAPDKERTESELEYISSKKKIIKMFNNFEKELDTMYKYLIKFKYIEIDDAPPGVPSVSYLLDRIIKILTLINKKSNSGNITNLISEIENMQTRYSTYKNGLLPEEEGKKSLQEMYRIRDILKLEIEQY